jgi:hypothetical protein
MKITSVQVTACTVVAATSLLAASAVHAAEEAAQRRITSIGCHHGDGTCFVSLDGAPFGGNEGCSAGGGNQFRWDNADAANGRRTYASLLAAYLQGKRVTVSISGCSGQGVPTVLWYRVHD